MAITRQRKEETIQKLKEASHASHLLIFLQFRGLTVASVTELRSALRAVGAKYIVAKKRFMGLVLKEEGTDMPMLEGEVAFVFGGEDPVSTAKEIHAFTKKHQEATIAGGVYEKNIIDAVLVTRLAKIPSREVLLAQLVGVLKGPQRGLVGVLGGVPRGFVMALKQIAEKKI
ncbi:MAG: 50S ribosomal protein L10 [Candidatus Ryanbacteria bacterium CG10_big_fil_rev_8_21_14_0_10_43_42]|uniref:Large ribosomal subunit protein uL10 n=1 Tax=Candidatus Ryanbacteria bacterium CG10_big_fil_rev_8_21_14_0_10_43_42 TaxID=1974864 RepID=A0A2M8KXN8_9BACT|nr:MAG: 50S ribosomal protein L10 [Candidatus Ryanbacteria bacterium CG10_big_fil_rev_8_21_14_0_10_43_42]